MNQILEFFFNLFMLIWENIGEIMDPIMNFISSFLSIFIEALIDFITWLFGALEWLGNAIESFFEQFGYNGPFGGGGGRPR